MSILKRKNKGYHKYKHGKTHISSLPGNRQKNITITPTDPCLYWSEETDVFSCFYLKKKKKKKRKNKDIDPYLKLSDLS